MFNKLLNDDYKKTPIITDELINFLSNKPKYVENVNKI